MNPWRSASRPIFLKILMNRTNKLEDPNKYVVGDQIIDAIKWSRAVKARKSAAWLANPKAKLLEVREAADKAFK